MQREVPGDLGAGTSSYSVMPSNIATKFPRYFEIRSLRNWFTSLFLQQWSLWCSAFSFGNISFITFWQFVCITSFYLSLTVILTSHFSNITYFKQQQQQNKPMKYYEILPTHCETPRNTTRKIANLYIEFNYHFLTLQKKIPLLLNRSVPADLGQYGTWQSVDTCGVWLPGGIVSIANGIVIDLRPAWLHDGTEINH